MGLLPNGIEILGSCPKCGCETIDQRAATSICADCGYTEREITYYITSETLPRILEVTVPEFEIRDPQ